MKREENISAGTGVTVIKTDNASTGQEDVTVSAVGTSNLRHAYNASANGVVLAVEDGTVIGVTITSGGTSDVVHIIASINGTINTNGHTIGYGIGVDHTTSVDSDLLALIGPVGVFGGAVTYVVTGLSAGSHTINLVANSSGSGDNASGTIAVLVFAGELS